MHACNLPSASEMSTLPLGLWRGADAMSMGSSARKTPWETWTTSRLLDVGAPADPSRQIFCRTHFDRIDGSSDPYSGRELCSVSPHFECISSCPPVELRGVIARRTCSRRVDGGRSLPPSLIKLRDSGGGRRLIAMSLQDWFLFSCYNPQTPHMNVMEQLLCLPLAVLGPMYAAIRYKAEEFRPLRVHT